MNAKSSGSSSGVISVAAPMSPRRTKKSPFTRKASRKSEGAITPIASTVLSLPTAEAIRHTSRTSHTIVPAYSPTNANSANAAVHTCRR